MLFAVYKKGFARWNPASIADLVVRIMVPQLTYVGAHAPTAGSGFSSVQ
jgi:hypothetical protein